MGLQRMAHQRFGLVVENACGWSVQTKLLMWTRLPLLVQESFCNEFFQLAMVPWVHYIPVDFYLETLERTLDWANSHLDEVDVIAANARAFSDQALTLPKIEKYFERLLLRYSKLARYTPSRAIDAASINGTDFFGCSVIWGVCALFHVSVGG